MRYLHFSSWTNDLVPLVGTELDTSWPVSVYWQNRIQSHKGMISSFSADGIAFKQLLALAKNTGEVLKEYVFEEIRAAEFPDKPSRRRCMFLLPPQASPDEVAAFLKLDPSARWLIEIEVLEGATHQADMKHLNCSGSDHSTMATSARAYWGQPGADDAADGEVLFCGRFRIESIVRSPVRP